MKLTKDCIKTQKIVVDGFNLIYKFEHLHQLMNESRLKEAMDGLVDLLNQYARKGKKKIKVFFDGKKEEGVDLKQERRDKLEVFYSLEYSADYLIMDFIKHDNKAGEITVITSDKQIQSFVGRFKSFVMKSEDFEQLIQKTLKEEETLQTEPYKDDNIKLDQDEIHFWSKLFAKKKN